MNPDAAALIEGYGNRAYEEARTRARQAMLSEVLDGNRPREHWGRVRAEMGRRTGRVTGLDTATRYLEN